MLLMLFILSFQTEQLHCDLAALRGAWQQAQHAKQVGKLSKTYHDTGVLIWEGEVVRNRGKIAEALLQHDAITEPRIVRLLRHRHNRYMELGTFKIGKQDYGYVAGWYHEMGAWRQEFQVVRQKAKDEFPSDALKKVRREWVRLANAANAHNLIHGTYTADTVYLTYGEIIKGREDLTKGYSYMNDPGYQIDLALAAGISLGDDYAMEIGNYLVKGSLGTYTLIWQQTAEGWRIAFDANF